MSNLSYWVKGLGIVIGGAIAFSCNSAIATFHLYGAPMNNSRVATQENIRIIEGGIKSGSNNKAESSVTVKNDAISEENSLNLQLSLKSDPICWIQNGQKVCLP